MNNLYNERQTAYDNISDLIDALHAKSIDLMGRPECRNGFNTILLLTEQLVKIRSIHHKKIIEALKNKN